jgi:isochorismatase family protein
MLSRPRWRHPETEPTTDSPPHSDRSGPTAVPARPFDVKGYRGRSVAHCDQRDGMTTLEHRPNTALLVVDVQNGVVEGAHQRAAVVANIGALVEKARRERVPVVWVQHSDEQLPKESERWRIVPELTPGDAEALVEKGYGDSFEDTILESVLADLGVGRLIVAGAQTDACIRSTLHGAFIRGYDTTLVSDAHTTEDQTAWGAPPPDQVIAHTNLYWKYETAPGREAGTVETKNVDFAGSSERYVCD